MSSTAANNSTVLAYERGVLYNSMKGPMGGSTGLRVCVAKLLASEFKVNERTVRRHGTFARDLDMLAGLFGQAFLKRVLTQEIRVAQTYVKYLMEECKNGCAPKEK